jgi:hypothetical protein
MVIKDIMTRKTYQKDGAEKVMWLKVGSLRTTDNGKSFIEMFHQPETTFFVFEQKPKEGNSPTAKQSPADINWAE